jgi:hypothetical protein
MHKYKVELKNFFVAFYFKEPFDDYFWFFKTIKIYEFKKNMREKWSELELEPDLEPHKNRPAPQQWQEGYLI